MKKRLLKEKNDSIQIGKVIVDAFNPNAIIKDFKEWFKIMKTNRKARGVFAVSLALYIFILEAKSILGPHFIFAEGDDGLGINAQAVAEKASKIFKITGGVIGFFGVFELGKGFVSDDGHSRTKGAVLLGTAGIFFALAAVAQQILERALNQANG